MSDLRRSRPLALLTTALAFGIACDAAASSDGGGVAVRDSAGIAIVESAAPGEDTPRWRAVDSTALRIGAVEGPVEYVFDDIEAALRLSDGRIVVADGGSRSLRFFDSAGTFLHATGRQGGGPGEFEILDAVHLIAGDTLLAWDRRLKRVSVVAPTGEFQRSIAVQPPGGHRGPANVVDATDDGRLLVHLSDMSGMVDGTTWSRRDTLTIMLYSRDGQPLDTLGVWAGTEGYAHGMTGGPLVFGRSTDIEATDGALFVADNDRYEILVHDLTGELRTIVRRTHAERPVTSADIDRYHREAREGGPLRPAWAARIADTPFPERMPAFEGLLVDAAGRLWVEDYEPWPVDEVGWSVFSPEGHLVATARTAGDLRVTQIGEDWILGVHRDDLGVQTVRLHRLAR